MTKLEKMMKTVRIARFKRMTVESGKNLSDADFTTINLCLEECNLPNFMKSDKYTLRELIILISFDDNKHRIYEDYKDTTTYLDSIASHNYLYLFLDTDYDDDVKGTNILYNITSIPSNSSNPEDLYNQFYNLGDKSFIGRFEMLKDTTKKDRD